MDDKAIIPRKKLVENLHKISDEKIDSEVVGAMQRFAEKMVTDIVNRACLIAKHGGQEFLSSDDISFIIEKDFDYCFGRRKIDKTTLLPTEGHNTKVAEIRSSRPH